MLKKLLYLYNDGHNPFPKLGKGGLGYHLPQYRKRMHGEALHEITTESGEKQYIDDENKDDKNLYSKEGFIDDENVYSHITPAQGYFLPMKQGGHYIPSEGAYYKPPESSDEFYVTKDPNFTKNYHGDQELNPYDIETYPPFEDEEYESKINDLNENIKDRINEYENHNKVILLPNDKTLIRQKIINEFMANKNNKYVNISYNQIKEAIKHFDIKPEDTPKMKKIKAIRDEQTKQKEEIMQEKLRVEQLIDDMKQLSVIEQTEILKDEYSELVSYYKNKDTRPGKGYELFICEGAGSSIIKSVVGDDNIEIMNFDKSPIIPKNTKDFCAIDIMYKNPTTNKGGIGEIKDYSDKDMNEYNDPELNYTPLQATKICGNSIPGTSNNFDIVFGKDDKTNEYYIIDIRYKNKPISQGVDIDEYLVSVNAKGNTWICDLMKQKSFIKKYINDNTMIESTNTPGIYKVDIRKIPKTMDNVSGGYVQSIRVKNKYFKPIIKK